MRELINVPIAKLHRSDHLRLDQLALVETLGIGARAVERSGIEPGESILVIGAGPIGLAVIQFAQLVGVRIIVMDTNPDRLKFCRSHFKIDLALEVNESTKNEIARFTRGEMPTTVFDATGNQQSMMNAFGFVAHSGKLVLVGLVQGEIAFRDPEAHRRELTIFCTRNSTPNLFRRIIALMESDEIDTAPWITHHASLADSVDMFASWMDPRNKVVKAMIELDGD